MAISKRVAAVDNKAEDRKKKTAEILRKKSVDSAAKAKQTQDAATGAARAASNANNQDYAKRSNNARVNRPGAASKAMSRAEVQAMVAEAKKKRAKRQSDMAVKAASSKRRTTGY